MPMIAEIAGVDQSTLDALTALGLETTDDLLRTNRAVLSSKLPNRPLTEIMGWQAVAELLQLEGLSPAQAQALRAAGADSLSEFADWTLAKVKTALPSLSDEEVVALLKEAVRLKYTGVLNGNVRLKDGTPVAGAEVKVWGQTHVSDRNGRFRAIGLTLDRKLTVEVTHSTMGAKRAQNVSVGRASALVGQTIVLSGRPGVLKPLSELRGDKLPSTGSAPMTSRVLTDSPDLADILMVISTYRNGDMQVASRYLDFVDCKFVRRCYRMAVADLPIALQVGDDIEWTGTQWTPNRYRGSQIGRRARVKAVHKRWPSVPSDPSRATKAAKAFVAALSQPK
jgi:hypothetical protein